jgi:hypothetical protein
MPNESYVVDERFKDLPLVQIASNTGWTADNVREAAHAVWGVTLPLIKAVQVLEECYESKMRDKRDDWDDWNDRLMRRLARMCGQDSPMCYVDLTPTYTH